MRRPCVDSTQGRRTPAGSASPGLYRRECSHAARLPDCASAPHDPRPGICHPLAYRHGARGGGDDPSALVRAARLDLGRRAQPPHRAGLARRRISPGNGLAAARDRDASSSTGRTRHACCRSRTGRSSRPRCGRVAAVGTATSARRTRISPRRSWTRSGRVARSAHGISKGRAKAACGTGSRRRRCSTGSGITASS